MHLLRHNGIKAVTLLLILIAAAALVWYILPGMRKDAAAGMVAQLRFDKEQYNVGDVVTVFIEYRNVNSYTVTFRPPSGASVETNYGRNQGEYPVVVHGWSVSPPELVGKSYIVPANGTYTLTSFELNAEKSGNLFVSYLGIVENLTIKEAQQNPTVVTLGVISWDRAVKRKFDYVVNYTLAEVNKYEATLGSKYIFRFTSERTSDTTMSPNIMREIRNYYRNMTIFVGFDTASALAASFSYAISNKCILMGVPLVHGYMLPTPPVGTMFRISPDLGQVYNVTVSVVKELGVDGVLVIQGDDSWGDGFTYNLGGSLGEGVVSSVRYLRDSVNYTRIVDSAATSLLSLEERLGSNKTAVLLVGTGEEDRGILTEAVERSGLLEVPWIVVQESSNPRSISNELPDISLVSPTFVKAKIFSVKRVPLLDNDFFIKLREGYVGSDPPPEDGPLGVMEASLRDSVWIACLSILRSNSTDGVVLKDVIPMVAVDYIGASGKVFLDVNGDRRVDYDVYQAQTTAGSIGWVKVGTYDAQTAKINLDLVKP